MRNVPYGQSLTPPEKAAFEKRNELLKELIGAAKQMRFICNNPHHIDDSGKLGPVAFQGRRGNQEIEFIVPIGEEI
jgi:hypothetical protein